MTSANRPTGEDDRSTESAAVVRKGRRPPPARGTGRNDQTGGGRHGRRGLAGAAGRNCRGHCL